MKIGVYDVLREIGRGGMGLVLEARAPDGRRVALKVLHPHLAAGAVERFERERRLLSAFTEAEGFAPLLDAGGSPRGPFVAMPFVPGGTLRARVAKGPLAVGDAIALGIALARAIGLAHTRGIVHRDLKPENVLFGADGHPLVSDLGLAKHFRDDVLGASKSVSLSVSDGPRGTIGYCPPEQMKDARQAGPHADVFALGVILYECLAGDPPFRGASELQLLARLESGEFVPLRKVRPEVPAWLARIVERAFALRPESRFADGNELAAALEEGPPARASRGPLAAVVGVAPVAIAGAVLALLLARRPAKLELVLESPAPAARCPSTRCP